MLKDHDTGEPIADPGRLVLNLSRPVRDQPGRGPGAVAMYEPRALVEHAHATLQVSVLLGGASATLVAHGAGGRARRHPLRGGQVFALPPGQPHAFRLARAGGMVNFHIAAADLAGLDHRWAERGAAFLAREAAVSDADPFLPGLAALLHAAAPLLAAETAEAASRLDAAWVVFAAHLSERFMPTARPWPGAGPPALPRAALARVADYVEANLGRELRVADLAGVAGYSPVHFTRLFAAATGRSPWRFVLERRLERGKALLEATRLSVAEVALRAGFGGHAHFSAQFRRAYGLAPRERRGGSGPDGDARIVAGAGRSGQNR